MLKKIFVICGIIFFTCSSFSQENDEFFGINLGLYNYLNYADFKELPGIPNCCPRFDFGYDYNLGLSLFYRTNLSNSINLQYDVRYIKLSSRFEAKETETLGTSNGFVLGEFTHYLNSEVDLLSIIPSVSYSYKNINFNLGFGISYFINKRYNQREQITLPIDRGTFIDSLGNDSGSRIRNANSGNLKSSTDFGFSFIPKISYQLNLNKDRSIFLEPNISSEINLFDISKEMNWKSINVVAGISLVFKFDIYNEENFELLPIDSVRPLPKDSIEFINQRDFVIKSDFDKAFNPVYINPIDTLVNTIQDVGDQKFKKGKTIIEYDTIVIKKRMTIRKTSLRYDTLTINSSQEYLNIKITDNQNKNINKIDIKETVFRNEFPILNKIYYDRKQISISDKYINYNDKDLHYYRMIDSLADRYKKTKNKINLKIVESDGDFTRDSLRLLLLKKYLNEEKEINYDDISINMISNANSFKNTIIEVESYDLNEPIRFSDTLKYSNIDAINLLTTANIKDKITNLKLIIKLDSIKIFERNYNSIQNNIQVDWQDILEKIEPIHNYLKFEIIAFTPNKEYVSEKIIKLNYNTIEKVSLLNEKMDISKKRTIINFEYNSKELNQQNIDILRQINNKINHSHKVDIIGYTDDIGNIDYNKALSLQRANEVKKYITNGKIKVIGAGINKKYLNNNTPEGKIYSRCVEIIISDN